MTRNEHLKEEWHHSIEEVQPRDAESDGAMADS
jgi:hypothetical protein